LVYPSACGQCTHSSPLHSRNYVRSSLRTLTFHSAFISCTHLSTAQLRYFPSFLFRKLHSYSQSIPKLFSHAFPAVCFILCGVFTPIERILLIFIGIGFFFQKDSKGKYNKDFLSRLFTDKKIKNLAKIRRPTQTNALGSKGRALRVFAIISTLRFTSGSILPKNLDSPIRPPKKMAIFFFFFLLLFFFLFSGGKIIYGRSSCF